MKIHLTRKWTPNMVINAIKKRQENGDPINSNSVPNDLLGAAITHWGSWDNALREAGLNPDDIKLIRRWSKEIVLNELLIRYQKGLPLNFYQVQKDDGKLAGAAITHFKRWSIAMKYLDEKIKSHNEEHENEIK